jgi:DNA-binding MarR family transcriptional regulator
LQASADITALRAPCALDDLLLYRVWRCMRASSAMTTRKVEGGFGITHREWGMIGMLAQVGELGSSELAERMLLDRVRTSRSLHSLLEKRLIERRQDADDRRRVHVQLSAAGRALFEELFPRIARLNIDLLDGLDEAHHELFLSCLHRLELRARELNANGLVPEKADRRSGGTRHRWPRGIAFPVSLPEQSALALVAARAGRSQHNDTNRGRPASTAAPPTSR